MEILGAIHATQEVIAFTLAATFKLYGLTPDQAYDRVCSVSAVFEQGLLDAHDGSSEASDYAEGAAHALDRVAKATRSYLQQI